MKQNSISQSEHFSPSWDKLKFPVGFASGVTLALLGSALFERKDSPTNAALPTLTEPVAASVSPSDDLRLATMNLSSPDSARQPASPINEAAEPAPAEISFADLSCDDPRFTAELNKRRELLMAAVDAAMTKCGLSAEQLLPPQLYDSIMASPSDRLRLAENAERAEVVTDVLFDMRGQLTWELRNKLDVAGVTPYLGDVKLPSNYRKDAPHQIGTFTQIDSDGKTELFMFDTINGQLCVRKIPPDWGEGQLIISLTQAENAISEIELK